MAKTSLQIRLVAAASAAILCACCSGCVIPVRVPTKTISVSGEKGKKLDLMFIKAGATTREEIVQKLGWVDSGVKDNNIFVGRWAESSWGVAWAMAGGYQSAGGWNRAWALHNLVVEFDDKGVVQQSLLLPDKDLLRELSDWISKEPNPSLDLSVPIREPIEYVRSDKSFLGTLVLSKDDFSFLEDRETVSKVAYDFKTPPKNVSHLSLGNWIASNSSHPQNTVMVIHFKQKTAVGRKLIARVDVPMAVILLKYIRQSQPGSSSK